MADDKDLQKTLLELEERVLALEQLLLADRLGSLDSRRLPLPQ